MRSLPNKFAPVFLTFITLLITTAAIAQTGEIRGFVYDKKTGDVVLYANVVLKGTAYGTSTDENGFYAITSVAPGNYTLFCTAIGFDSTEVEVTIEKSKIITKNIYINEGIEDLEGVVIDHKDYSKPWKPITVKEMQHLPTIGGEPEIVQYLQILPGVITSGDQGGQLYIRGGSPIMNKVLLDGMTIYNPFHSIGLFSVFDADIIKTTDVYSAAFGAEYGGRISAIMDVKTRDGNKNRLAGKLSSNTFSSKILLEGPLKKFKEGEGSSSFILSYKNSYLDKSANTFYKYANPENLPYSFSDFYGKISIDSRNGSKVSFFGFNYNDKVAFDVTQYNWKTTGVGAKFLLVPDGSKNIIDGFFAYSGYDIEQTEKVLANEEPKPRRSSIGGFNVGLNFNYFLKRDHIKWGLEINGFKTDFEYFNSANRRIGQVNNTTELSGFLNYKHKTDKYYIEPGMRIQVYASLGNISLEPRLNFQYFITDRLTFRAGAGLYSQNLLSSISDRDVVNLFYGFLSGPDELPKKVGDKDVIQKIQKAKHAIVGIEYELTPKSDILIETYVKDFGQIININRDKIFDDNIENNDGDKDPPEYLKKDFVVETGLAYGADFRYKYESKDWYLWATYSYTYVERFDGIRTYNPHFDRRHNVNLLAAYQFGKDNNWEFNTRWSYGSGFPFTLTQGFYENLTFSQGVSTDYTSNNGQLGIQYADLNTGRQPEFHRLDASLSKKIIFTKNVIEGDRTIEKETGVLNIVASCTNIYNRENIFYFNRVQYKRINQLPILPSVGISYKF